MSSFQLMDGTTIQMPDFSPYTAHLLSIVIDHSEPGDHGDYVMLPVFMN